MSARRSDPRPYFFPRPLRAERPAEGDRSACRPRQNPRVSGRRHSHLDLPATPPNDGGRGAFLIPAQARRDQSKRHEPVAAFHPAAGGDDPAHGGGAAHRHRRLSVPAALRSAGGRLSHHPGPDLLSRRQPRCDDLLGHGAAGAPAGPDAQPAADGVDQLRRRLGHHAAVQPRHQPRYRGAGGAGGDQCGRQSAAFRSPGAARSTPRSIPPTPPSSLWR